MTDFKRPAIFKVEKGAANGVATLDASSKVPAAQMPTHASNHAAGGSDVVTLTIAQTTGLQTALDAKAASSAPATAVSDHESSYAHAQIPTLAQKQALAAGTTPGTGNPYATINDLAQGAPVADLAALTLLGSAYRRDKQLRFVESVESLYAWDEQSTETADELTILEADDAPSTGRWKQTRAQSGWGVVNGVTGDPLTENFDGSVFNVTADWAATNAYSLGDFVKPTSANGFIYECVVAGDSDSSEPTWATVLDDDQADDTATWRCRGLHVLETTVDQTANLKKGAPLKYIFNSTTYYGQIVGISSTRIALRGAPLDGNYSVANLYYAGAEKIKQVAIKVAGTYGDGVADLVSADNDTFIPWDKTPGALVGVDHKHKTDDTGTEPKLNVKLNGTATLTEDGDDGFQASTTRAYLSWVAIDPANYGINFGELIELACTVAGGTGDADTVTAILTFILE